MRVCASDSPQTVLLTTSPENQFSWSLFHSPVQHFKVRRPKPLLVPANYSLTQNERNRSIDQTDGISLSREKPCFLALHESGAKDKCPTKVGRRVTALLDKLPTWAYPNVRGLCCAQWTSEIPLQGKGRWPGPICYAATYNWDPQKWFKEV